YPEISPYVLRNWMAVFINDRAILANQYIYTSEQVVVNIIHDPISTIVWIWPFSRGSFSAIQWNAFVIMNCDHATPGRDSPPLRKRPQVRIHEAIREKAKDLLR